MAPTRPGAVALASFVGPLIEVHLPELDPGHREDAVSFVVGRWERMRGIPALGLACIATAVRPGVWLAGRVRAGGRQRFVGWVSGLRVPLIRDLVDFSLALSAAYAFERWPPAERERPVAS